MRARIGVFAAMLFVVVGFAPSALACEKCVDAGYNGWKKCEAGYSSGKTWCTGGFGVTCSLGDACGSGGGGGIGDEVESPDFSMSRTACLTCSEAEPGQGFVLYSGADASADGIPQQRKVSLPGRRK
jgi:hypothetical protein